VVVPTAHPERPLQLPIWQKIFQDGRPGWIFLTEEERRFLRQWFPGMNDGPVIGCGIASRTQLERMQKMRKSGSSVFKDRFSINGPFVLYTGRVDSEKGCRTLIACFLAFLRQSKRRVTLVLVGSKAMTVPEHPSIIATGFIENDLMLAALSECSVYIHPSPYESFSFSLLEAMAAGAPVLVTAECDVLRGHVIRSRAGLYYRDMKDFVEKLTVLLDEPERFQTGPQYVQKRYSHEAIRGPLQRYLLERIGDQ
jgi:glycosyltransferase involved in cell wall biosynthesis